MKTEAIKQSIISNYKILSEKAKVERPQENVIPMWRLKYKDQGYVSQSGSIKRKGIKINIREGEVITRKKPLFSTQKSALKKINNMLEEIIANINNEDIIRKKVLYFLRFKEQQSSKMKSV